MLRVGLTGGIASGKSAVADLLAEHGAVIIDADVLAREAVAPGTSGLAEVIRRFGAEIAPGGRLDRARLGEQVFADPSARRDLEAIVHPRVRDRAAELERAAPPDAVVVQVIPLLVETGQSDRFDVVVVVDATPDIQRRRLMKRNALTSAQAEARLNAQASRAERLAAADLVITNDGDFTDLAQQVGVAWSHLQQVNRGQ